MRSFLAGVDLAANVLSIAVVVAALCLWIFGRNPLAARALNADRLRTLGPALETTGMSPKSIRQAVRRMTKRYSNGQTTPSIQAELTWLDEIAAAWGSTYPVSYYGLAGSDRPTSFALLSDAYSSMSLRLQGRGLLGGGTSPLLETLAGVCEGLSSLLAKNATFAAGPPIESGRLRLVAHGGSTHLELAHLRLKNAPGIGVDDVAVSYLPRRLIVPGTPSERIATLDSVQTVPLELNETELNRLRDHLSRGKAFDGVLPSLRDSRVERDPASGRTRLHCVLSESSFSSVIATHYAEDRGVGRPADELSGDARLFTLAFLPETVDQYFVMTTRTKHVSIAAGQVSPAVTGNLEMRDRTGVAVDRDGDGIPDPLLALLRECSEELAIAVSRDQIEILGVMEFSSPREANTTVLLTTSRLGVSLQEIADGAEYADRLEGAWESEEQIIGVPVPKTIEECLRLLAWTLTNQEHVPHVHGCLIAYCYPMICEEFGAEEAGRRLAEFAEMDRVAPAPPGVTSVRPRRTRPSLRNWFGIGLS